MSKDLMSFSDCGTYFASCGEDGTLRIWETSTGALKQDCVPSLRLNSPCSSLIWISVPLSLTHWKSRKRKLDSKATAVIIIGSVSGTIGIYSVAEGKIFTLEGGHSSTINDFSWSSNKGLFAAGDDNVVCWDIYDKSIECKWKCGKGKVTSIAVSENGDQCVTGSFNLKLWDVETSNLIKTFTGHSSEIVNLHFVNQNYFVSSASNDRYISACGDSDPVGRFGLSDNVNGDISIAEENGSLHMCVATKNGSLHYFRHQLNGKIGKSIKPSQTVEITTEPQGSAKAILLPISSVKLSTPSSAHIVYGYSPKYSFELIKLSEGKENRVCLIRSESVQVVNSTNKVVGQIADNVEYTNVSNAIKRKANDVVDAPMEDRLCNLSLDYRDSSGTSKQSPYNMSHLLIQGLESKDKSILDSVLMRREPEVIKETVSRLPIQVLSPLLQEIKNKLQGKTITVLLSSEWLKAVMRFHASQLIADASACEIITSVQSFIDSRLSLQGPLCSLTGRLDQLLYQLESPHSSNLANLDPVVLFQDDESSDDGESLKNDNEGDESEDKWDEFSDQPESEDMES